MKKIFIIILLLCSIAFADDFTSDLLPESGFTNLDIGTSALQWRDAFGDGTLDWDTITDGTFSITAGVGTGLVSLTDGTASWSGSSLSGFISISGTTLTDKILSINSGSITSAVDGTFSGTLSATTLTDTVTTITGGNYTSVGNLTGIDIDISAGTGSFTGSGTSTFGEIIDSGLTASKVVFTDGSKQLTSTAITSGDGVFWSRTGTILSPITADDDVNTAGTLTAEHLTSTDDATITDLMTAGSITHAGWTWTGAEANWSNGEKIISLSNETIPASPLTFAINSLSYLAFHGTNSSSDGARIEFGNVTDNPAYTFFGSGLTTLGGNLLVNGGDIGITADANLLQLAADALTLNGNISINGASSGHHLTINQGLDSFGLVIFGFDDRSAENGRMSINSSGNFQVLASLRMIYTAGTDIFFRAGTNKDINFADNTNADIHMVAGGGNVLIRSDNSKLQIGATVTDLQISSDGTNGIIQVATALKIGDDGTTTNMVIEADGDTFWVGDGSGLPYACMYVDGTQAIVVALSTGVIAEVKDDGTTDVNDGWLAGDLHLITFPTGGDEHYLSVTKAGFYRVQWSLSFNTANPGANVEIHGGIAVDGTPIRNKAEAHRTIANNSDTGNMSGTAMIECPNGTEQISVWLLNSTNNADVTVEHGNVSMVIVGGT